MVVVEGPVVGISLMNRVHLAELRGPHGSLVQTRSADQSGIILAAPFTLTPTFRLLLRRSVLQTPFVPRRPFDQLLKKRRKKPKSKRNTPTHLPLCLNYLFPPMPTVNPGALAVGFSDSLALLSQVEHACRFLPAKFISPASGSGCEVIRERGLQPSDPAATLFSVK